MSEIRNSRTFRTISINDLKPFKDNPLSFSKKSLRKHEALVREHGQIPAIQVTTDLTIVAGEEWWLALKNAGETQVKPVAMLADILRDCTKRGDLVIDPCLESGSTLMAAEQTGRTCIGIELNPRYLDVAIRRWQAITGHDAIHLGTGQRFEDVTQNLLTFREG